MSNKFISNLNEFEKKRVLLGKGSSSKVFKVKNIQDQKYYAIKIFSKEDNTIINLAREVNINAYIILFSITVIQKVLQAVLFLLQKR